VGKLPPRARARGSACADIAVVTAARLPITNTGTYFAPRARGSACADTAVVIAARLPITNTGTYFALCAGPARRCAVGALRTVAPSAEKSTVGPSVTWSFFMRSRGINGGSDWSKFAAGRPARTYLIGPPPEPDASESARDCGRGRLTNYTGAAGPGRGG
jgi:hypothetical protein